jgi:HEAT repeat protein
MQKEVEIRLHALYSLARIRDKEATPALLRALSDRGCLEDAGILQIQMDFGLPEIVALNKASMVRPYELLPFSCVRDGAVYALGQGGDPQATNALLSLLSDGKASIRFAAVLALAHYPEKRIVAVFIEKLHDKESGIVVAAITALNCMKAMEAVDPLRALASETKDELVKKLAEGAIDALTKPSTTTPRPAKKRMPIEPKQGRPSQRKNR